MGGKKSLVAAVILAGALATNSLQSQETQTNNSSQSPSIENVVENEYRNTHSLVSHTFSEGETIRTISSQFSTANIEKLEWILDTYNTPLSENDRINVIETSTDEGLHYPYSVEINYDDNDVDDILLVGQPEDLGYAIKVSYHDEEGITRRVLWTNKRNHSFYDVASYNIDFPLDGLFEDYIRRISSEFWMRENPARGIYGGPDTHNHRGIDIPLDVGTEISASYDGTLSAGYRARTPIEDEMEGILDNDYSSYHFLGKVAELRFNRVTRNSDRQRENQRVRLQFFHLSDFPEEIKHQFAVNKLDEFNTNGPDRESYYEWYNWFLSEQDEDEVYRSIRRHNLDSYRFSGVNVRSDDTIAYSGNTGISTGPHIHIGVIVNGQYVNPRDFFNENSPQRGMSVEEAESLFSQYRNIYQSLTDNMR
ncbi:MAG: M23 family metallopeptidase [Nanoarchaeota archaeon]